jgi:hypothetical protein
VAINKREAVGNVSRPAFNGIGLADASVTGYLEFQDSTIALYLKGLGAGRCR